MARTDWKLEDVVKPEDMNQIGKEINSVVETADKAKNTAENHAFRHVAGGPDEITPAMIGAETPAGSQSKADAAEAKAKSYMQEQLMGHINSTEPHQAINVPGSFSARGYLLLDSSNPVTDLQGIPDGSFYIGRVSLKNIGYPTNNGSVLGFKWTASNYRYCWQIFFDYQQKMFLRTVTPAGEWGEWQEVLAGSRTSATTITKNTNNSRVIVAGGSTASVVNGSYIVLEGIDYNGTGAGGNITFALATNGRIKMFQGPTSTEVGIIIGLGSPNGMVTANVGSIYLRRDGGTGATLYTKESGTGNTGWVAK